MRHYTNIPLLLLALVMACEDDPVSARKTMYIGPKKANCIGVGPQQCLQVKDSTDKSYGLFYGSIEGFFYEEGYEYEIVVAEELIQDPPADGSSIKYILVEVVSKQKVEAADDLKLVSLQQGHASNILQEQFLVINDLDSWRKFYSKHSDSGPPVVDFAKNSVVVALLQFTHGGSKVTIDRLLDSRCPKDAQCIWEGRFYIDYSVDQPGSGCAMTTALTQPYHFVMVQPQIDATKELTEWRRTDRVNPCQ